MLEQEERCNAKSLEYLSRLKIEYKAGQREIERQLEQYYEKYATENGMQPAQLRRNMKPEEWKDYQKQIEELLQKTGKAKERAARNRYLSGRISRLQALQNQVELEVDLISKSHDISMLRHLRETYEDSYYHNAYYGAKAGIHARFDKLNPRMVEEICKVPWSGKSFSERIWGNTNKLKLEVRRLLSTGSICGTPLQVLSKRLSNRMEVSYHRAATLVRTESAHIRDEATFDSYKKMGVERYRILATLDTRTSAICQSMDGKEFACSDKSVGETYPPFHPNCRTTTVPVVEDFSFSDTRAAKDKEGRAIEVPKDMTYPEWYETYILGNATKESAVQKAVFKPASTLQEAEIYARETLGISLVSYSGCSLEVVNSWNEGLQDSFLRFPKLREYLNCSGEMHQRNKWVKAEVEKILLKEYQNMYANYGDDVLKDLAKKEAEKWMHRNMKIPNDAIAASWNPGIEALQAFTGITMNRDRVRNSKALKKTLESQEAGKDSPVGCNTIRYILDHEIGHQLDKMLGLFELPEIQELYDTRTKEELTEGLSRYSWNNINKNRYSEMIAEAWAEYCNNPEPREIARKVGETMEQEYRKKYGGIEK